MKVTEEKNTVMNHFVTMIATGSFVLQILGSVFILYALLECCEQQVRMISLVTCRNEHEELSTLQELHVLLFSFTLFSMYHRIEKFLHLVCY